MHVFSSQQFGALLDWTETSPKLDRLLDIGAGDGATTERMAGYFNDVFCTEMSLPMKWTLQRKGYT